MKNVGRERELAGAGAEDLSISLFPSLLLTSEFGSSSQHIPKSGSAERQGEDGEDGDRKTVRDTEAEVAALW